MSRDTVLSRGRLAAEAGMVDTCSIQRKSGETTDPFSGVTSPSYTDLYDGKCRLQQGAADAQQQDVGEAYILLQRIELQLPISVVGLDVGDQVTLTASPRDADLVGRVFLVRDLHLKTDATSRRLRVEEQTS